MPAFPPPFETQPIATIGRAVHQLDQRVCQAFGTSSLTPHNFTEGSLGISDLS